MDELAPAKVNLALHVVGRRADGYHELDSVVIFADVADRLSIEPAPATSIEITGPFAKGLEPVDGNLVLKAHALLAAHAVETGQQLPNYRFRLEKNLPVAAGIGGGSADAAAALRLLLRASGIALSQSDLNMMALRLGADVPVCLSIQRCRMRGVGEQIEMLDLRDWQALVLVNPNVPSATAQVFARLGLSPGQPHGEPLDLQNPSSWRNDLQPAAQALTPEIAHVLAALGAEPAIRSARMSGSGATCFGMTDSLAEARAVAAIMSRRYPHWWVKAASIL